MIDYRKILALSFDHISQRTISASTGHARNTVSDVIRRAAKLNVTSLNDTMTNVWLEEYLYPEKQPIEKGYCPVDWEYVHKELQKKHVTLKLLHHEYAVAAKEDKKIPYAYRTFAEKYGYYARKFKLTMPLKRKPGEIMEVDWAGATLSIQDRATGEDLKAYVFVAALPYSQMMYVEAFLDMTSANWLKAHIHAFDYFGGVPETLVPDNLKTGVIKAKREESVLNEAYRELADHYRTVIVPSRVQKPKDKPSAEGSVGHASRQIIAALRNAQCFHINELNQYIAEKLEEINTTDFQKRPGTRKSVFEEEEKSTLQQLPPIRFKMTEWKTAKVQLNYHIQVERMYYSVPYEYARESVDIRLTTDLIEVYFKDTRIASHKRLKGDVGQYSTNIDHMPDHHRSYVEHNPENSSKWAASIGPFTEKYVAYILENHVEKKALQMINTLQNLTKKYAAEELEQAITTLLEISSNPSNTVLKGLLERTKQTSKAKNKPMKTTIASTENHGFTRGAAYFGREKQ